MPRAHGPLRVVINAQLLPGGRAGGVEQFVVGLVRSLGRLDGDGEEYLIVGHWQDPNWLEPHLGPHQRIVSAPKPAPVEPEPPMGRLESLNQAPPRTPAPSGEPSVRAIECRLAPIRK